MLFPCNDYCFYTYTIKENGTIKPIVTNTNTPKYLLVTCSIQTCIFMYAFTYERNPNTSFKLTQFA